MNKSFIRIAAGIALCAIIATSFPATEVSAASNSIFPAAGGALAAGQGTSIRDIRANVARNAAKNLAVSTHSTLLGSSNDDIDVKKSSVVASQEEEKKEEDATPVVQAKAVPAPVGEVAKVETPSSKAVNESVTVNGVSVVGSASEAAQIEVTETTEDVMVAQADGSSEAAPLIDVQPDVEVGEGEEDLTRTVIAVADPFVNVRSIASEDGEVVGKLYNHSAGSWLGKEGDWYKIESGSVIGYVKGEFVVTGQAAVDLAAEVGERVAVVTTTTLKIREEASTESKVLGMVGMEDRLTVIEETDEWVKVSIEEGDGWVSKEFLTVSTEFPKAESAAEEAARLKKEEEDRRKANAAAQKATKKSSANTGGGAAVAPVTVSGSGLGSQVANFACQFVGNPYVYGGTSLTNGTDCSGFTSSVYRNFGVSLPHSSGAQRACGYGVGSLAEALPGDIICYSGHVGIYIGGGQIVHASTAATGIKISNAGYRSILAIRRIF